MVQIPHTRENKCMEWFKVLILFLTMTVLAGCPDKQEVPPKPGPPEPQATSSIDPQARHYRDLIRLEGRAPHVGTRYEVREMMA